MFSYRICKVDFSPSLPNVFKGMVIDLSIRHLKLKCTCDLNDSIETISSIVDIKMQNRLESARNPMTTTFVHSNSKLGERLSKKKNRN